MTTQRRSVADEPAMSERVDESSLSVDSPRRVMILGVLDAPCCTSVHCAANDGIGVVAEYLHADRRRTELCWSVPSIALRLTRKIGAPRISMPITEPRFHNSLVDVDHSVVDEASPHVHAAWRNGIEQFLRVLPEVSFDA
jgi:hypothetical protein